MQTQAHDPTTDTREATATGPGTEQTTGHPDGISRVLGELAAVGASWAHYGLSVGRDSLISSARTLESTASLLDGIAARLRQPPR